MLFFQRHHYDFAPMFGFPMYDAMFQLNADLLLLHFYCMTDEEGYGMTIGQLMGRFYKFLKTYGLKSRMDLLLHIKPEQLEQPDTYIIILTKNFILLDKDRKKHYVKEWHYMNLREMDKDGNFLVSSWGENYMLRKADIMERVYFIRVRYLLVGG